MRKAVVAMVHSQVARSVVVVLIVLGFMVGTVWAAVYYVEVSVDVKVDASAVSALLATPDTFTAEATRPGQQFAFDIQVENIGEVEFKEILVTQRGGSPHLALQAMPTGPLGAKESITVRVILTVGANAQDGKTLTLRIGLIGVQ